jgi:hypothetical protein
MVIIPFNSEETILGVEEDVSGRGQVAMARGLEEVARACRR